MFTINQGFDLNSPQFNFKRDYFASVADLKAAAETNFPDHFITNVAGVLYQLTKSNSVDTTTGKWRKVQLGSDVDLSSYAKSADVANTYAKKSEAAYKIQSTKTPTDANDGYSFGIFTKDNKLLGDEISIPIVSVSNERPGVMSVADKKKLDGIAANANNYTLPTATTAALGGIKTGYTTNGKNYKVEVDASGNAFVNVPWTDNQDLSGYAKLAGKNTFTESNSFTNDVSITGDLSLVGPDNTITITDSGITSTNGAGSKLFATNGSIFDASTLATTAALAITNTNVTNLINTLNNIQASNKIKSTALPIASATALGAIKLGTGLTATADGTVNVSADVVAGSVEWDNVKNKPTLLEARKNVITKDTFVAVSNGEDGSKGFTLNPLAGEISVTYVSTEGTANKVTISTDGIKKMKNSTYVENQVFMTDGTTAELTSITTDELNAILV